MIELKKLSPKFEAANPNIKLNGNRWIEEDYNLTQVRFRERTVIVLARRRNANAQLDGDQIGNSGYRQRRGCLDFGSQIPLKTTSF